ncbi:Alpha-aminoadipate--LysW ligase LysX [Sulfuracidifex tepidarius]|uniref:Alpha-aminoadipate--LysW ligase LysX n=2 Tax=Sulfuracidifex tepidarius TaxID=1294262 RepID=A0A510DWK5_9CREN|nr:lysine biosynthesis protein LysX [Sulfuracidifex tepidarius]BBG24579.1 Alpha-aminoadipate--LysW ligase LysX [Sulfuracidifex tepidarius]
MKVGIAYDLPRWEEKNIIQEAKNEGHQVIPFYSKQGIFYSDSNIDIEADLFIQRNVSHSRAVMTSFLIESQGIPIVNDYVTLIKSENKAFTTFILSRADIKTPRTAVSMEKDMALSSASTLGYPVVIKPIEGSWGRMIAKAQDEDSLRSFMEYQEFTSMYYRSIYYIQEFVKKPDRDIRIFAIGDDAPVGIYRVNPKNWRTNTALGAKAEPLAIDAELRELALKVKDKIGGFFLGIDVFEDKEKGYVIDEVNGVPEFKNTVRVTGFNVSKYLITKLMEWYKK